MAEAKRCIGFSLMEDRCGQEIDAAALQLNRSGLWCSDCEKRRRAYISGRLTAIKDSFGESKGGGKQ